MKVFVISAGVVLCSLAAAMADYNPWTFNFPMSGNTVYATNTAGTGNTPTGERVVQYRIGKYISDEWLEYGSVIGDNESFGGWYLNIPSTNTGNNLIGELRELVGTEYELRASVSPIHVQ